MSTAVDLVALAAQGELKIPIARGVVSQGGSGTDYTGWSGVSSVFVEAKVEVREQSRGFATLSLAVEGSSNGSSWSTLQTFTFGHGGSQSATVSSPPDHLRVSWAVGGGSEWQIIEVTAAPSVIDFSGNGGSQAGAVRWLGPCKTNAFAGQEISATSSGGGTMNGGTFTLSYGGDTTALIAHDATPAQVVSALEALSSIGAGNVVQNPLTSGGGPALDSGYDVLFKELTATALLTGDGSALTGPDSPYSITVEGLEFAVEMFTPAVGDIIEDFMHVVVEGFETAAKLYYTDSAAHPTQNGPAWSLPTASQGVNGLALDFDDLNDYTNFSGLKNDPGTTGQPTSLLALIGAWAQGVDHHLYTNLPTLTRNSVPIYSYITDLSPTPTVGEVWIWVKVSTPAPLMD